MCCCKFIQKIQNSDNFCSCKYCYINDDLKKCPCCDKVYCLKHFMKHNIIYCFKCTKKWCSNCNDKNMFIKRVVDKNYFIYYCYNC